MSSLNNRQTQELLAALHRGGSYAALSSGTKCYRWYNTQTEPLPLPENERAESVFFSVHPLSQIPPESKSGNTDNRFIGPQKDYIGAVNCFFAEWDGKDFVGEGEPEFLQDKAQYLKRIEQHIDDQLPIQPSAVWFTGGGYQAVWLLNETVEIDDANRQEISSLQKMFVRMVGGDRGAASLKQVLRLPGSYNVKPKYAPDFPLVQFVKFDIDVTYTFGEIDQLVTDWEWAHQYDQNQGNVSHLIGGFNPVDQFNADHNIVDMLTQAGYQIVSLPSREPRQWRLKRPGGRSDSVCVTDVRTTAEGKLVPQLSSHYSSSDPLYTGETEKPLTAFAVYTKLYHKGSFREAYRVLNQHYLSAIPQFREYIKSHSFRHLFPDRQRYRIDFDERLKRILTHILDLCVTYGKFDVILPYRDAALAIGAGVASAKRYLDALEEAGVITCLNRNQKANEIHPLRQENEAHIYRLTLGKLTQVFLSGTLGFSPGRNDIISVPLSDRSVYHDYLSHDAFLVGRRQEGRARALSNALRPDGYRVYKQLKNFKEPLPIDRVTSDSGLRILEALKLIQIGEASVALVENHHKITSQMVQPLSGICLRLIDYMDTHSGVHTLDELSVAIDISRGAVANAVKKLERRNLLQIGKDGRKRLLELRKNWRDILEDALPTMRTNGLTARRAESYEMDKVEQLDRARLREKDLGEKLKKQRRLERILKNASFTISDVRQRRMKPARSKAKRSLSIYARPMSAVQPEKSCT